MRTVQIWYPAPTRMRDGTEPTEETIQRFQTAIANRCAQHPLFVDSAGLVVGVSEGFTSPMVAHGDVGAIREREELTAIVGVIAELKSELGIE